MDYNDVTWSEVCGNADIDFSVTDEFENFVDTSAFIFKDELNFVNLLPTDLS